MVKYNDAQFRVCFVLPQTGLKCRKQAKEDPLKYAKYTGPPYFDDGLPRFSNGMLVPPPGNPLSPF